MTQLAAAASGLGFGLSLIVAIGAQNAFVIRQGLLRRHVLPVVGICALSDAFLIVLGVAGLAVMVETAPSVLDAVRIAGAIFLFTYAGFAIRRALQPSTMHSLEQQSHRSIWAAVTTALALTWLNPHVYLDTVLLLGGVANSHGEQRWWFGGGAMLASVLWFTTLGYGARVLRPVFARKSAWRVLDVAIAITMSAIAVTLVAEVL